MIKLICPVCSKELTRNDRSYQCEMNHSFDIAKQGYVNLLTHSHKDGSLIGDNKDMALSRKAFLEKGYFDSLKDGISNYIKKNTTEDAVIVDICCGEGYYSHKIKEETNREICGFDISKEMVKLAGKRKNGNTYFVANLSRIPLETESVDLAFHLFAPFHEKEIGRILKENGIVVTVVSGENHLFELKEILYDTPYKNDEKPPETDPDISGLRFRRLVSEMCCGCALICRTGYGRSSRCSPRGKRRSPWFPLLRQDRCPRRHRRLRQPGSWRRWIRLPQCLPRCAGPRYRRYPCSRRCSTCPRAG